MKQTKETLTRFLQWEGITDDSEITLVADSTSLKGDLQVEDRARIHGKIEGNVFGSSKSVLVLCESSVIRGKVAGAWIWVDGQVEGDLKAHHSIELSSTARVIGNVTAPDVRVLPGAQIEGRIKALKDPESQTV